jgi:molybdopterin-containing oxidoreductase family membrane subunit
MAEDNMALRRAEDNMHTMKLMFWIIGFVLFAGGIYGWAVRFISGHVDANYGSVVTWGLWVAAYIYFIGLSAGAFLISSLVYVFNVKRFEQVGRLSVLTALITLILALLSIWADLGHEWRAWHVMVYPNFGSLMAWMIYLYSCYMIVLFAEFWLLFRRDFVVGSSLKGWRGLLNRILALGSGDLSAASTKRDAKLVRIVATIGVPLAVCFHGGVGALFGVVAARPHWHSGLFPILFLLSALVGGGALLVVVSDIFQKGWKVTGDIVITLGKLVLGLLLLDILFQVSEFLVAYRGGIPSHVAALDLVVSGTYWWVFWIWQNLFGTVIPILILVLPTRNDHRWVSVAAFLIFAGLFGLRLNIVIPGLAVEEIEGLSQAIASNRVNVAYIPSMFEWAVTAGIVGLGMLMFGLSELFLPEIHKTIHIDGCDVPE